MAKPYPTADLRRCHDCGVLPGRDHHFDCQSREAHRIRKEWEREEHQHASPENPPATEQPRRHPERPTNDQNENS